MILYQIDFAQKKDYKIECGDQLIHIEEYGNKKGIPAVFFHGGPGQGFSPQKAGYFDPNHYRIILIDQRGCGQSIPKSNLETNNTLSLLKDADTIRQVLGIDQWVIAGNSWGATLALLYAEKFPEHVSALVLRGTFLAQRDEGFSDNSLAAQVKPNEWMAFKSKTKHLLETYLIDESLFEKDSQSEKWVSIYHYLLTQNDFMLRQKSTAILAYWLNQILGLVPFPESDELPDEAQVNAATIEFHYSKNHYFLEPNHILKHISPLEEHQIPVHLIHGTKDLICSPSNSDAIQRNLPSHLVTRYDVLAGHIGEEVTEKATVAATCNIANMIWSLDKK